MHKVSFILLLVGGINWLLFAFGYNLVSYVPASLGMVVYVLIGLSAVYEAATHKGRCKECEAAMAAKAM
jgi:uncharacterized membrane protein YuzA (DUF378 family)